VPHQVSAVEFSPDGSTIAAIGGAFVSLVDRETEAVMATLEAFSEWNRHVSFNEDGSLLAAETDSSEVAVWDTATFRKVAVFDHETSTQVVAFAPGTGNVMIGDDKGGLATWDTISGELVSKEDIPGVVHGIEFNPADPTQLVVCAFECVMRDLQDGSEAVLSNSWGWAEFSPSGEYAATLLNPTGMAIWSTSDRALVAVLPTGTPSLTENFAFTPDESAVLALSGNGIVRWELDRARPVVGVEVPPWTYDVEFADEGATVLTTGEAGVRAFDLTSGAFEATSDWPELLGSDSALSPDQSKVASVLGAAGGNGIQIWNRHSGEAMWTLLGHTGYVVGMDFDHRGDRLASISRHEVDHYEEHGDPVTWTELLIWDVESGEILTAVSGPEAWVPRSVDFRSDGKAVAVLDAHGDLSEWDPQTGERLRSFDVGKPANWEPFQVRYSPHGGSIAVADEYGVTLWDLEAGTRQLFSTREDDRALAGYANRLAFSPDGRLLAASMTDLTESAISSVYVWDLERGEVAAVIPTWGIPGALAFSPDGDSLAVLGGGVQLHRFEISSLEEPRSEICAQTDRRLTDEEWAMYLPGIPKGSIEVCN
jgi:WD40 repeat protein